MDVAGVVMGKTETKKNLVLAETLEWTNKPMGAQRASLVARASERWGSQSVDSPHRISVSPCLVWTRFDKLVCFCYLGEGGCFFTPL